MTRIVVIALLACACTNSGSESASGTRTANEVADKAARRALEQRIAALEAVSAELDAHLQASVELDKRLDVAHERRAEAKSPEARAAAQAELDAVTADKKRWDAKRVELQHRLEAALAKPSPRPE